MESKVGSILLLISGILTFILAFILLLLAILVGFFSASLPGEVEGNPMVAFVVLIVIFAVAVIIGILKLVASKMMKDPDRTTNGGILALVVGIIGTDILAIIGGILGIVQGSEKQKP